MKKLLALSLATLMVMSLATVAFAAAPVAVAQVNGAATPASRNALTAAVPYTSTDVSGWFTISGGDVATGYSITGGAGTITPATLPAAGGTFTYTPTTAEGGTTVTLTVAVAWSGGTVNNTVDVVVAAVPNSVPTKVTASAPVAGNAYLAAANGTSPAQSYTANVSNWFTDADGDVLTYTVSSATPTVATASIPAGTSALTVIPVAAGTSVVTVTATDPSSTSVTHNVTITVSASSGQDGTIDLIEGTGASSPNGVFGISKYGFGENSDNIVTLGTATSNNILNIIAPGKTMYYPLFTKSFYPAENYANITKANLVTVADAVKSVSISTKYTLGQGEIESIKVQYKKYNFNSASTTGEYAYFLGITTKESQRFSSVDFAADVTVKKSSGTDNTATAPNNDFKFNLKVGASFAIQYPLPTNDYIIYNAYRVYDLRSVEDEQTFEFDKFSGAYFEIDVTGQERLLLKADAKFNSAVAGKYPAANINFFNGYGGSFNKIGELHLPAASGSFLYLVNADNSLSKVNAVYDDGEECFVVKTRTLAQYAISDRELDVATSAPSVEAPSEAPSAVEPAPVDPGKQNPGTGAKA